MSQLDHSFGKLHPQAPPELSRFSFLLGQWRCDARVKGSHGEWQTYHADWVGRFVLDGYAIADEYRMTTLAGELIVLGMNVRTYDAARQAWNIRWLHAQTGAWTDLASEQLGGVQLKDGAIRYAFKEPMAAHPYTRATYTNISETHFTWLGEKSEDGEAWSEFMVVEAYRCED